MSAVELCRDITVTRRNNVIKGTLVVGPVERLADGRWACCWSISVIHEQTGRIFGADAMESVERCFQFIGTLIEGSRLDGYEACWKRAGDNAGVISRLSYAGDDAQSA